MKKEEEEEEEEFLRCTTTHRQQNLAKPKGLKHTNIQFTIYQQ